jgi:hypothetical protein
MPYKSGMKRRRRRSYEIVLVSTAETRLRLTKGHSTKGTDSRLIIERKLKRPALLTKCQ